jgi:hypothetical protein
MLRSRRTAARFLPVDLLVDVVGKNCRTPDAKPVMAHVDTPSAAIPGTLLARRNAAGPVAERRCESTAAGLPVTSSAEVLAAVAALLLLDRRDPS